MANMIIVFVPVCVCVYVCVFACVGAYVLFINFTLLVV